MFPPPNSHHPCLEFSTRIPNLYFPLLRGLPVASSLPDVVSHLLLFVELVPRPRGWFQQAKSSFKKTLKGSSLASRSGSFCWRNRLMSWVTVLYLTNKNVLYDRKSEYDTVSKHNDLYNLMIVQAWSQVIKDSSELRSVLQPLQEFLHFQYFLRATCVVSAFCRIQTAQDQNFTADSELKSLFSETCLEALCPSWRYSDGQSQAKGECEKDPEQGSCGKVPVVLVSHSNKKLP